MSLGDSGFSFLSVIHIYSIYFCLDCTVFQEFVVYIVCDFLLCAVLILFINFSKTMHYFAIFWFTVEVVCAYFYFIFVTLLTCEIFQLFHRFKSVNRYHEIIQILLFRLLGYRNRRVECVFTFLHCFN